MIQIEGNLPGSLNLNCPVFLDSCSVPIHTRSLLPLPLDIGFIDLVLGEELRQIIPITDQHQLMEFPADRILEPRHLFASADAGANNRDFFQSLS